MTSSTAARVVRFDELNFAPRFEYGEMARVTQVSGTGDGSLLGTGFGRFTNAEIPWTVRYDEVLLVLEGELTVRTVDGDLVAGPQTCICLPPGTSLTYIAEDALVFYAVQPANWAAREDAS